MLPSLSGTTSVSSSPIYSESSIHPLSESSTLCSLSSSMKSLYPMLQKTNISLNSHHICTDLNIKTTQQEVIEFSPFIRRQFVFEIGFSLAVFSKTTKVVRGTWPSFHGQREHKREEQGPHSMVRNVVEMNSFLKTLSDLPLKGRHQQSDELCMQTESRTYLPFS